jgi:hypothetical protein
VGKFARPVKEGIGEIERIARRVAVLTFIQIAGENRRKLSVVEKTARQRIEQRREAADAGAPCDASWAKNSVCFAETSQPVFSLH